MADIFTKQAYVEKVYLTFGLQPMILYYSIYYFLTENW